MNDIPCCTLVGAGPGDPELLTLKAVRALRRATVILADDLVGPGVLRFARRHCRIVTVGKRGGCRSTPQEFIEQLMIREARAGERVVRLKGGDPFVFGRGGEEIEHLRAAGIRVEIVPGITAALAAAPALGAPLTHRRLAHGVALVTGHPGPDEAEVDWRALAASGLTLVVYMGAARAAHICAELIAGGMRPDTPAGVVQHATLPQQAELLADLRTLPQALAASGLGSPCILVIGDVLRARAALQDRAPDGGEPQAAAGPA